MSINEIQQAITKLSPEELARLREWFEEYHTGFWDTQIEADVKSGRLDKLIAKVDEALIKKRRNESERPLREYLKEKMN